MAGTAALKTDKVTVSGVHLTASSMVLATPQAAISGVAVEGVVLDVAAKSLTIHLTKPVTTSLHVAWFVIETAAHAAAPVSRELARAPRTGQQAVTREHPAPQRPALAARHRPVLRTGRASHGQNPGRQGGAR